MTSKWYILVDGVNRTFVLICNNCDIRVVEKWIVDDDDVGGSLGGRKLFFVRCWRSQNEHRSCERVVCDMGEL